MISWIYCPENKRKICILMISIEKFKDKRKVAGEFREKVERIYEWETEMDLRAVPALYWPVSGRRSAWEIYGDFRIWYRSGAE